MAQPLTGEPKHFGTRVDKMATLGKEKLLALLDTGVPQAVVPTHWYKHELQLDLKI